MDTLGYVGEDLNKILLYLAASSRILDDPISVMILSQSASGKSMLVSTLKKLIPPEDVISLTSLSDQALNYIAEHASQVSRPGRGGSFRNDRTPDPGHAFSERALAPGHDQGREDRADAERAQEDPRDRGRGHDHDEAEHQPGECLALFRDQHGRDEGTDAEDSRGTAGEVHARTVHRESRDRPAHHRQTPCSATALEEGRDREQLQRASRFPGHDHEGAPRSRAIHRPHSVRLLPAAVPERTRDTMAGSITSSAISKITASRTTS